MGMDLIPVYAATNEDKSQGDVFISPAMENNLGVKTALVNFSILNNDINTVGFVRFDEDRLHHIHLRVEGWIEQLNVSAEGEEVKRGQVLFQLYSPVLFNAQKDLVSSLNSGDSKLIGSARHRLRLLGMDEKQIEEVTISRKAKERISIFAKDDGIVSGLHVRHGMFITPSLEVMAIGSIDTVWVIAEVFERQSAWLLAGQAVTIRADSHPGARWQGLIDYVYPVLNEKSRTLKVRVRIDNRDQRLKPNMVSDLVIHTQGKDAVYNIPRSALIRGSGHDRVVMALGEGRFRSVAVLAGREAGQRVEIIRGLKATDRVVTSSQFLIDSESAINSAMKRTDAVTDSGEQ
jgi:Cu(I)/Ag(I) efflux system membrane fusion protein